MRGPRASGGGRTFADFYYRNVAISEGCGCSELVIRRDGPRKSDKDSDAGDAPKKTGLPRWLTFWRSGWRSGAS